MALIAGTEKALEVNYTPAGKVLPASLTKYQGYLVNFDFFLFGPEKIQTTTFDVDYYDAGKFEQVISDRIYNPRSEEHTSELQSLMRISYAVFCLKKKQKEKTE